MNIQKIRIENIPALLYGTSSEKLYIYVHGRYSKKEEADTFASIVTRIGYQVLSFDLPEHGERIDQKYKCTIQNSIHDLMDIYSFAQNKYKCFSLYACSIGAYFSLSTFQNIIFDKCLFVSPVLNMKRLIQNMMKLSNITEEVLKEKKEIETTLGEIVSWDYYEFIKNNQIKKWKNETHILYGENDNITERDILDSFVKKYKCNLEIHKNGEHWFHTEEQLKYLENWIKKVV